MRIAQLQNDKCDSFVRHEKQLRKDDPILSLEEILTKVHSMIYSMPQIIQYLIILQQLALSYYLDYLSMLNLQKYVLFYMSAHEWKQELLVDLRMLAVNQLRVSREELLTDYRERAQSLCNEYLNGAGSNNYLTVDAGLVEVLNIRLRDQTMPPDGSWFESISKFIYEKIKTEEVFLHNFYQSSAYKKLLLELGEEETQSQDIMGTDSLLSTDGSGSDNNSGDIPFEVFEANPKRRAVNDKDLIRLGCDLTALPFLSTTKPTSATVPAHAGRHNRSHSDCSGIVTLGAYSESGEGSSSRPLLDDNASEQVRKMHENVFTMRTEAKKSAEVGIVAAEQEPNHPMLPIIEELSAKIINTAINTSGQYAVYAIEVVVSASGGQVLRQWHVYRRYSKFLELKKVLEKRYPTAPALPFPPKKTFQNTQRAVLEHRMTILNDFLREICQRMRSNAELKGIVKDFLEADPVNQISGGSVGSGGNVTRTLEIIVNPFKSGMTKIKNMPDSLVGGLSRLLSGGRGTLKHHHASYLMDDGQEEQMDGAEYPALRSMLNLMDEVFDLQTRSQWLRRGIVNRVLGAPWVSSAANKKIVQAAKGLIEEDKIEMLLTNIL